MKRRALRRNLRNEGSRADAAGRRSTDIVIAARRRSPCAPQDLRSAGVGMCLVRRVAWPASGFANLP
jgi:hypothetical protein